MISAGHFPLSDFTSPLNPAASGNRGTFEVKDYKNMISGVNASEWHSMSDERRSQFMREKRKREAFKTEMCKGFLRTGFCRYGTNCRFAHSPDELRLRPTHPKYKTELCLNFSFKGECGYGSRCQFIHRSPEKNRARPSIFGGSYSNATVAPPSVFAASAYTHRDRRQTLTHMEQSRKLMQFQQMMSRQTAINAMQGSASDSSSSGLNAENNPISETTCSSGEVVGNGSGVNLNRPHNLDAYRQRSAESQSSSCQKECLDDFLTNYDILTPGDNHHQHVKCFPPVKDNCAQWDPLRGRCFLSGGGNPMEEVPELGLQPSSNFSHSCLNFNQLHI